VTICAGLDVRDKTTYLYVVDTDSGVLKHDVTASSLDMIANWLGSQYLGLVRVVLETGPLPVCGWLPRYKHKVMN
jgi:hypothetical protein